MHKRIAIIACCLFSGLQVFSQGLKDTVIHISTVEVSAKRLFIPEEAGMKSTRIDSLVLTQKANQNLSQILSENTHIFIKDHGRGALATASFRGTAASHTQVNWNGISINNPMAGMVDFSLIPAYIIDDLSLKHGTASISDKGGGLGGSVNIANRVNWDNKAGIKYLQTIGSYHTRDEFLQLALGNRKIQAKTRVYHNYSRNDYTFINHAIIQTDPLTGEITSPPDTNDNAEFLKYGVMQEVYFRPDMSNTFSLRYWGQYADRTIPRATSYEGPDNSNNNRQNDTDHRMVINWKRYGKKSRLSVQSGYAEKQLTYSLLNMVSGVGQVPAIYSTSRMQSSLNSADWTWKSAQGFRIESSLNFNYYKVNTLDTVSRTGYNKSRPEAELMISTSKSFNNRLNIRFLLRQNNVDRQFTPTVPYLGFDYRLIKDKNLIIKGNIARNYHTPALNDLYSQPGGNPDLLPEKGFSFEGGLEYQTQGKKVFLTSEMTAYRSDIKNWIIWIPSYKGYWEPRNIKRVLSRGIEINANLNVKFKKTGIRVSGNYAYTSSVNYGNPEIWGDNSYGKQLVYVPLHSGNVLASISYKGYYISWQHNAYSERFTTSSNDVSRRDWLYPYFMNDLTIGKDLKVKKLNISAEFKIYNLFNETYHTVLYRPMPGRNYLLMLVINL